MSNSHLPESARECHRILKVVGNESSDSDLRKFLRARARTNKHLARAFALNSSFTTQDIDIHLSFVEGIREAISSDILVWDEHSRVMKASPRNILALEQPFRLVEFFQSMVIDWVCPVLVKNYFEEYGDGDEGESEEERALRLARILNGILKQPPDQRPTIIDETPLFHILWNLVTKSDFRLDEDEAEGTHDNPLNIILAGYEEFSNAIISTFLQIQYRTPVSQYVNGLIQFSVDADEDALHCEIPGTDGVTAEHIIKESLRLCPPTRRVYRSLKRADNPKNAGGGVGPSTVDREIVYADIEACHHDPDIWGPDSMQFRPQRWREIGERYDEDDIFLAFGRSPHKCPAQQDNYAVIFIGCVVGALCHAMRKHARSWQLGGPINEVREVRNVNIPLRNGWFNHDELTLEPIDNVS